MSYVNAGQTLPEHLIAEIQTYVDGVYLYIPRKAENKKQWGTAGGGRETLLERDRSIYDAYCAGSRVIELAETYFLSVKTVQRIVCRQKKLHDGTDEKEACEVCMMKNIHIVRIDQRPQLLPRAADWFHAKWGIPREAYEESMRESLAGGPVPMWLVAMDGDEIVGGLGVIENDFHQRKDLAPNVCAVYVEEAYRGRGIAGDLLARVSAEEAAQGVDTLYLATSHTGFYERYGWTYFCPVLCDGEDTPSRMYRHIAE